MHECLMQIDAIGKASGKLCSQIETLAEKCTEHVPRTLIKARGSRAPIAEHLVKTAENSLKILQAWRRKFACFKRSDRLKATGRALQTLIKPRDKEPLLDPVKRKRSAPAKRLRLAEPAAPVIALPPGSDGRPSQGRGAALTSCRRSRTRAGAGAWALKARRGRLLERTKRRRRGTPSPRAARPCLMRAVW